ncbi:carbohydrate ABC transporter permease [Blautia schinkii]|nr:carbohydrate ABC transporter permease [Blautia schinkii]
MRKQKMRKISVTILLLVFSAIIIFPLAWMFLISIRNNNEVFTIPTRIFPETATIKPYLTIMGKPDMMRLFLNSYIVTISVTVLSVFLAMLAGYGLSRFTFRGKRFTVLYLLLTQMFPLVLLSVPYFLVISKMGLYNTRTALVIVDISFALPFSILMMRDFISTIPVEIDEAAIMDGCTRLRTFFQIIIPVSAPGIVATAVYTFILAWNEFLYATILTSDTAARTLPVGIGMLIGQYTTQYNEMMALSVMASIPLIIAFLFFQKYFVEGMTAGSVKN